MKSSVVAETLEVAKFDEREWRSRQKLNVDNDGIIAIDRIKCGGAWSSKYILTVIP
jgi:hypothetical protein